MADAGHWEGSAERAVLVGVDLTTSGRRSRPVLDRARNAGLRPNADQEQEFAADESGSATGARASATDTPGLDADESLAEFRELVRSAGGEVAAELMQRRARPDPATLIGHGKVEEIAGAFGGGEITASRQ